MAMKLRWHELGAAEVDDGDEDPRRSHVQFWPQDHRLGRLLHQNPHTWCSQVFVQVKAAPLITLNLLVASSPSCYRKKALILNLWKANTIPFVVPALWTGWSIIKKRNNKMSRLIHIVVLEKLHIPLIVAKRVPVLGGSLSWAWVWSCNLFADMYVSVSMKKICNIYLQCQWNWRKN